MARKAKPADVAQAASADAAAGAKALPAGVRMVRATQPGQAKPHRALKARPIRKGETFLYARPLGKWLVEV